MSPENLIFSEFVLLEEANIVKFFEPPDQEYVSCSVQNIRKHFSSLGSYITVNSIGPQEVVKLIGGNQITVIKLNIEGSKYLYFLQVLHRVFFQVRY